MSTTAPAPSGTAAHVIGASVASAAPAVPLVLVSGISGYIGLWVAKTLLTAGFCVRGTVRSLSVAKKLAPVLALQKAFPSGQLQIVEADLERPDTWPAAVAGCTYVQHVASPFPLTVPRTEEEINALIRTAVSGTVNVLTACASATPQPRRVVVTSSIAAVMGIGGGERPFDEAAWTDSSNPAVSPYFKSKTLAERAAWNFVARKQEAGEPVFELATVHPGYVMGPMLTSEQCTSAEPLRRMLTGGMPLVPDVPFNCVDVRDVARGHVLAMLRPEAAGGRHLLVGFESNLRDMADILARHFRRLGYGVATGHAPDCLIRCGSACDPALKQVVPSLGKRTRFDTSRSERVLGMKWTTAKDSIEDMAYSMIENGLVPNKLPKDHGARMLGREWMPHADGLEGTAAAMSATATAVVPAVAGAADAGATAAGAAASGASAASTGSTAEPGAAASAGAAALESVLGDSGGGAGKEPSVPAGALPHVSEAAGESAAGTGAGAMPSEASSAAVVVALSQSKD